MAKPPSEQRKTDRERISEQGSGKLDSDPAREATRRRAGTREERPGDRRGFASPDEAQDLGQKSDTEERHD